MALYDLGVFHSKFCSRLFLFQAIRKIASELYTHSGLCFGGRDRRVADFITAWAHGTAQR